MMRPGHRGALNLILRRQRKCTNLSPWCDDNIIVSKREITVFVSNFHILYVYNCALPTHNNDRDATKSGHLLPVLTPATHLTGGQDFALTYSLRQLTSTECKCCIINYR